MRTLGECSVTAHLDAIPRLEEMDPEPCYTEWDVLTTAKGMNAIRDVFIFVENDGGVRISSSTGWDSQRKTPRDSEILQVERGDVVTQDIERVLQDRLPIGRLLVESGATTPAKVLSALSEQEHVREVREKRKVEEAVSSLRVRG